MEIGINLSWLLVTAGKEFTLENIAWAADLCAEAGFRNLDYLTSVTKPNWRERAEKEREIFDSRGLKVAQTHCPFFRYQENGTELFREFSGPALEVSRILGSPIMVVHADELPLNRFSSVAEGIRANAEFIAPVVEKAAGMNIRIAVENLFEEYRKSVNGERTRCCGRGEEADAVIDFFHDPERVGLCWDFGHGAVAHKEENLKVLDGMKAKLFCLHVHDNRFDHDSHLPPYFGNIDWKEAASVLRRKEYAGIFSLELVYCHIPAPVLPRYLKAIAESTRFLLN